MIIIWFLILLTVIVFVHELGHYFIARLNGVRVEVFSVGFGRELIGFNDSKGTRWKFSVIPLGGYVKFFGDANLTSNLPEEQIKNLSDTELNQTFHIKSLRQKSAIVFAGPLANFIFAFIILFLVLIIKGTPSDIKYYPIINNILDDSAAYNAGFMDNDEIISVNDYKIESFLEVRDFIVSNPSKDIYFKINRNGNILNIVAKPDAIEVVDKNGAKSINGRMGFSAKYETIYDKIDFKDAFLKATIDTYTYTVKTFEGITDIIIGKRSASELGGPIMIASVASKAATSGLDSYLFIMAIISINLGLINLFPIPLLDGGHLLLYGIQSISKKIINEVFLKYYYGIGMFIIFALMILVNYNDLIKQIN
ncbi:MAG: Metalloprotease MmpA [Alphaproteobacteria bacterium MarineAlpha9_Bin3]|nr:MAG: Metalloprotease MmpA [Alphaproteobacteria bacterium MarineAlpha9_Bin3]